MTILGHCGVLYPRKLKLADVVIDDAQEARARQYLAMVRGMQAQALQAGDPRAMTVVTHPLNGVEPALQQAFGALCASLFTLAINEPADEASRNAIGALALAVYRLRPRCAFIIRGTEAREGVETVVIDVDCQNPAVARQAIHARPEIAMLRDFQSLAEVFTDDQAATSDTP